VGAPPRTRDILQRDCRKPTKVEVVYTRFVAIPHIVTNSHLL